MVDLTLIMPDESRTLKAKRGENFLLPNITVQEKSFLGWSRYADWSYGFMNIIPTADISLYPILTDGPAYTLHSEFRGVEGDLSSPKSQFRRYAVDLYLENATADHGEIYLENVNNLFYCFGVIAAEGVEIKLSHNTNQRGGAYNGEAYFTTSEIKLCWQSEAPVDATAAPQKIGTLLLCFGRWATPREELLRRTSDDIIIPDRNHPSTAGETVALVSANFYGGEKIIISGGEQPAGVISALGDEPLQAPSLNAPLCRFALLSDSHVGKRYGYENYNWLNNLFKRLSATHQKRPLDFVLQLGDNIDDGYAHSDMSDYSEYLELIKGLDICDAENPVEGRGADKIPHYELMGNHDPAPTTRFLREHIWFTQNKKGEKVAFVGIFARYGGYPAVNFSISKSGASYLSYGILPDETVEFAQKSVKEAAQEGARQIILCCHFGIAEGLSAPILPETGLSKIIELCEEYGIKVFLSGHEHNQSYTLFSQNGIYNYDVARTFDKYALCEVYEEYMRTEIYNTCDGSLYRTDIIPLKG